MKKTKKRITKASVMAKPVKVKFNNITKQFGSLVANDKINFSVVENEIHALLGENGAGKSTLMSILFGLYKPTYGTIEINGKIVKIKDPRHANELKIAMLPQHFKLVDNMTVYENVVLGYEKINGLNLNKRKTHLKQIAKQFKLNINIEARIEQLSIADMQKVEILKILWRNADIIIFDEPTSILTPQEIKSFLDMVKYMKSIGKTILLITHKLQEIKEVADRVSIIRKGKYISTVDAKKTLGKKLAQLMVGKEVDLNLSNIKRTKQADDAKTVLEIKDLEYKGIGYETSLSNIDLEIKEGEIVGIAAIDGNGQSELVKIIAGLNKFSSGSLKVNDEQLKHKSIEQRYFDHAGQRKEKNRAKINSFKGAIKNFKLKLKEAKKELQFARFLKDNIQIKKSERDIAKFKEQIQHTEVLLNKPGTLISHIPEDRHRYGLVLDYTVSKNVVLQDINYFTKFGFLINSDIKLRTNHIVNKYDVRGVSNEKVLARSLSGGNQQKLILGREIEREPKLLLAAHPTRGLDVGAIRNVYESIIKSRNDGMSVLLLSGELDEIMQVSDRIIVMYNGNIISNSKSKSLSKLQLGSLMAGGRK